MAAISICIDFGAPPKIKSATVSTVSPQIRSPQLKTLRWLLILLSIEAEAFTRLTKFYITYNPVGIVWMFMLWCTGTLIIGSMLPLSNRMELPLSSEDCPEQLHRLCP